MPLSAATQAALYYNRKRNRSRSVISSYGAYVAPGGTLHDFGAVAEDDVGETGLVLLEGIELAVAHSEAIGVADIIIEDNAGQEVAAPSALADQIVKVNGFFPRGRTINIRRATGSPEGDVIVYLVDRDRRIPLGVASFGAGEDEGGRQPAGRQPEGRQPDGRQP